MKFQKLIPHDITISPTPNGGFICTVGCVKVAYAGISRLIQDLTQYLENPEQIEKQYEHDIGKLDRIHLGPNSPIPVVPSLFGAYHRTKPSGQPCQEETPSKGPVVGPDTEV